MTHSSSPLVIVHGGVDCRPTIATVAALYEAAKHGYRELVGSGEPSHAVRASISDLEDDPTFNAGTGSVLNDAGEVECDAGIADARTGRAAGVAGLLRTRNPIAVAHELMVRDGPVLLAGEGANAFGESLYPRVKLTTDEQARAWRNALENPSTASRFTGQLNSETVGCIAVSQSGWCAAGSSTGGLLLKPKGRVGDAPIVGAGYYATRDGAAVCSGDGEACVRRMLALRVVDKLTEMSARLAVDWAIRAVAESRATVTGTALYSRATHEVSVAHSAQCFPVVACDEDGPRLVSS